MALAQTVRRNPLATLDFPTFSPALDGFCRDEEGWGPVSENFYDFTPCFSEGVLVDFTSLFIIILGSYQISQLFKVKPVPTRKNWHYYTKLALVGLLAITTLSYARQMINVYDDALMDVRLYATVFNFFAMCVAMYLHHLEHNRSRVANGVLLVYWLLVILTDGARLVGFINREAHVKAPGIISTFGFSFIISICVFVLEAFVPKARSGYEALIDEMDESPLDRANVFSRLTFTWMYPLMKRGYEAYLTDEDLPGLAKGCKTDDCRAHFDKHWHDQKKKSSPSIALALVFAFGRDYLVGMVLKICGDILAFSQPLLLRRLILFIISYTTDEPEPFTGGLVIAFGMFFVSLGQTAFQQQYYYCAMLTGMKLKTGLTSAIYHKSLVLSGEAKSQKSTGDIVNLMSVDAQRLHDFTLMAQFLWSGPFQIGLCLYNLHDLVGNSMWAGFFVMVLMIPVNGLIARKEQALQKEQMKTKDLRTRLTTEILNNIKSLKLYGWEKPYMDKLSHVRNDLELGTMKVMAVYNSVSSFMWTCAPFLVSCSTFGIFVFTSSTPLTTDLVFPALAFFNLLTLPLSVLPRSVSGFIESSVAAGRLRDFFLSSELQDDAVERKEAATNVGDESVSIRNGTFLWEQGGNHPPALKNIDFVARKGGLACIVGRVGSGKSGFMQAILGDLFKEHGSVVVRGRVAYAAQSPWIMNATVRDNITFGYRFDADFYEKTVKACALIDDFAALPDSDETLVGEKGISLSGGQKARLSLARAVYARADVYILDDPLSAVDQHVGRHLIDNVLGPNGLLASRTRVLATNSITVLSQASNIVMLRDGEIIEQGTYEEVMTSKAEIYNLIKEFGKKTVTEVEGTEGQVITVESGVSLDDEAVLKKSGRRDSVGTLRRASTASIKRPQIVDEESQKRSHQAKEHSEQGQVKWAVYKEYAKAANLFAVILSIALLAGCQGFELLGTVWLEHWSEVNTAVGENPNTGMYLGVYSVLGFVASALAVGQTLVLRIVCTIQASRKLHNQMAEAIVRSPMSFFDTTPVGRIINRFTTDIYRIDDVLGGVFAMLFNDTIYVCFTFIVISATLPAFIPLILPVTALYLYYQRFYLRTSRELKRLDSVSRSPIYAHFQESLSGVNTIRAFRQSDRFSTTNELHVDHNLRAYFLSINTSRWLGVRLEFACSLVIFATAGLSIVNVSSGGVSAGLVGLAMTYALQVTRSLAFIVRLTSDIEVNTVSVERILEYARLPSEAPAIIPNRRPPAAWPGAGEVVFEHYSTRYREGLDLVLKDINLHIKPREKVGIVGRTGAGKSSLTLALFRMIEPEEGHIDIDALDTSTIGLSDLRQRLAIIPQDSQAFEGTIRDNLDPAHAHDDTELWEVLELSHLKEHVSKMDGGLSARVAEAGSNLSVGQRQLMSLARALLTPSKVLVLDEATAAVDVETDQILQETIRKEFKDRTILTIAHRLNTIIDSDKIVVLSAGKVAEFDSPENLLANPNSMFYSLCKQGGLVGSDEASSTSAAPADVAKDE
ncbi:P-loop containing nucleoside triphosphate hydrolase protein [Lipomyces tetrasporus]|uniref:P-loop containing nucleoside triphosphate hydrolase protein n=1 Tax=Lipomyces tetrasporus TaxID=54092 RepID=A0AAD7VUR7_9ASCO|nr:P-loop containing nucleoside triphosphate hydrolase protein [Lipomyces tetrasporus]KAJ8102129.1 P-loop containing nucleoside triphosphate hydrolase protein [Lipomyces tetrasporus]